MSKLFGSDGYLGGLGAWWTRVSMWFEQASYFTPAQTTFIMYATVCVFAIIAVISFLRVFRRERYIMPAVFSIPFAMGILTMVPQGFSGMPDYRCQFYMTSDGAPTTFELIAFPALVAVNPEKVFEDKWIVLMVRATAIWGNEVHTCKILEKDPRIRHIVDIFYGPKKKNMEEIELNGVGAFWFTFGGPGKPPNVTFKRTSPPGEKNGPPDRPPRQEGI